MIKIFDSQTADDVPLGQHIIMALWSCREEVLMGRCSETIFSQSLQRGRRSLHVVFFLKFKMYSSIFRIQFYHQPQTLYGQWFLSLKMTKSTIIVECDSWAIFWFFLSHMIALSVWCLVKRHTRTNDVRHQSCHFYSPYHFVYSRVLRTVRFSVNNDIKSVLQSSAPLWPLEAWSITHQLPLTSISPTSMNTQSFTSYFTRSLSATSPSLLHSFVSLLPPFFLSILPFLTPFIHLCCAELFNQTQEYLKPFPN